MEAILHKANTRGHTAHSWLQSWHTFSFAGYHDATRMHFGALRVLNDDTVAPASGFGSHRHDNMEIVTIPLHGNLAHQDSMGNQQLLQPGDVQAMSAGTGITHSEKNNNSDQFVKFLQVWVLPNRQNVEPRYHQKTFSAEQKHNNLLTIVSPMGHAAGVNIYQDAWFSLGKLDEGVTVEYKLHDNKNGVYIFVLEGDVMVNEFALNRRDGLGLLHKNTLAVHADTGAELLLMELPLTGE